MIPNPLDYPRWLAAAQKKRLWSEPDAAREAKAAVITLPNALEVLSTSAEGLSREAQPVGRSVEEALILLARFTARRDLVERAGARGRHELTAASYWGEVQNVARRMAAYEGREPVAQMFTRVHRHVYIQKHYLFDVLEWTDHLEAAMDFPTWARRVLGPSDDATETIMGVWGDWYWATQGDRRNIGSVCEAAAATAMAKDVYAAWKFSAVPPYRPNRRHVRNADDPDLERDVANIIADQDARAAAKAKFQALVWEEFEDKGIVALPARDAAFTLTLTHSTYPGVAYQVTRWEGEEPTGHMDARSRASALDEMWYWCGMGGWRERWERRRRR